MKAVIEVRERASQIWCSGVRRDDTVKLSGGVVPQHSSCGHSLPPLTLLHCATEEGVHPSCRDLTKSPTPIVAAVTAQIRRRRGRT